VFIIVDIHVLLSSLGAAKYAGDFKSN